MQLSKLLINLDIVRLFGDDLLNIKKITDDSRKVIEGSLFVAIKGLSVDGYDFIDEVIKKGAAAVVGEKEPKGEWLKKITYIQVKNSRKALAFLASAWYGNPSGKLKIISVTGTDGKTTTASLIHHILISSGKKAGLITTVGAKIGRKEHRTGLHVTNPEPLILHKLLAKMVKEQCMYVVLEVTSHGLHQDRVFGIDFDIGVLTNITHEHTDYHKTWKAYKNAKLKLFKNSKISVLNYDDHSFAEISKVVVKKSKFITYSLQNKKADFFASNIKLGAGKNIKKHSLMQFDINVKDRIFNVKTKLLGDYNVSNILAASAVVFELGISSKKIISAIESFSGIPGRLEEIENNKRIKIYIDFAHTPNSLKEVLTLLNKDKGGGRLICVFGCAGERDIAKREMMGEISVKLADISIFTAEDPRNEDQSKIFRQIEKGAIKARSNSTRTNFYLNIPERSEAIFFAIHKLAKKGDTIIICGKGHEGSMAYGDCEHPWSDKKVIYSALSASNKLKAIVMAAGRGKRMNHDCPKVIRSIAGRPMIAYTLEKLRLAGFGKIVVVVGFGAKEVTGRIGCGVTYAYQKKPMGTGDATAKGLQLMDNSGSLIVLNADDSAFYKIETIKKMLNKHKKEEAVMTFLSLIKENPTGLGRIIRNTSGTLQKNS